MKSNPYIIENYWNQVAQQIKQRKDNQLLAGDDEPYYEYKRALFLQEFDAIDFENKTVLEFGCGPGGNLLYLYSKKCKQIIGVDIAENMIQIAKENLKNTDIQVFKIDGVLLPFKDNTFDIIFTSTVLQHVVDNIQITNIINELCRVAKEKVILFERTEKKEIKEPTNCGRTVQYYQQVFESNHFSLSSFSYLPIKISYLLCGISRKLFDRSKKEGAQPSFLNSRIQKIILLFTKKIDRFFKHQRDLTKMVFVGKNW